VENGEGTVNLMMVKILLFILVFFAVFNSFSQVSDMLSVQRKNGRIIKTITSGSRIDFFTKEGNEVGGIIDQIRDDSIFITYYDIRASPNQWGVTSVDTLATYHSAFNYREISSVQVSYKTRFVSVRLDRLLMIGGAGYFILNLVNSNYLRQSHSDNKNLTTLALSAGVFGTGFFMNKFRKDNRFTSSNQKIIYVKMRR
jgi:hypothetical protein